jgi:hypothetical protein
LPVIAPHPYYYYTAVFYDKFRYRSVTSDVIDYCWQLPPFRAALTAYAAGAGGAATGAGGSHLLKLANAIVNDINHHMEESLKSLTTVREVRFACALWGSEGGASTRRLIEGAVRIHSSTLPFTGLAPTLPHRLPLLPLLPRTRWSG